MLQALTESFWVRGWVAESSKIKSWGLWGGMTYIQAECGPLTCCKRSQPAFSRRLLALQTWAELSAKRQRCGFSYHVCSATMFSCRRLQQAFSRRVFALQAWPEPSAWERSIWIQLQFPPCHIQLPMFNYMCQPNTSLHREPGRSRLLREAMFKFPKRFSYTVSVSYGSARHLLALHA